MRDGRKHPPALPRIPSLGISMRSPLWQTPHLLGINGWCYLIEWQIRQEDNAGTPHIDSQGCCSRHASVTTNHLDGSLRCPASPCDLCASNNAAKRITARYEAHVYLRYYEIRKSDRRIIDHATVLRHFWPRRTTTGLIAWHLPSSIARHLRGVWDVYMTVCHPLTARAVSSPSSEGLGGSLKHPIHLEQTCSL